MFTEAKVGLYFKSVATSVLVSFSGGAWLMLLLNFVHGGSQPLGYWSCAAIVFFGTLLLGAAITVMHADLKWLIGYDILKWTEKSLKNKDDSSVEYFVNAVDRVVGKN